MHLFHFSIALHNIVVIYQRARNAWLFYLRCKIASPPERAESGLEADRDSISIRTTDVSPPQSVLKSQNLLVSACPDVEFIATDSSVCTSSTLCLPFPYIWSGPALMLSATQYQWQHSCPLPKPTNNHEPGNLSAPHNCWEVDHKLDTPQLLKNKSPVKEQEEERK